MNSFRKYTECVNPSNFTFPLSAYTAGVVLALVAVVVAPLILFTSIVSISLAIGADLLLIAGCVFYLYGRLICLGGQQCAIGVVTTVLRPYVGSIIGKFGDDDATMNVLLAPGPTDTKSDPSVYWNQVQGGLVKPNDAILNIGLSYPQSGGDLDHVKNLHCEFEGSGIHDFLQWLELILAVLVALLAVMLLFPEAAVLLWFLRLLAILWGGFAVGNVFLPGTSGDPTDVSQSLGNLQAGDIVVVTGDWIYDSGHAGWNEIHAVHNCQIIPGKDGKTPAALNSDGTWPDDLGDGMGLDTPPKVQQMLERWCSAIGAATGAQTGGSTKDPANNWIVHPLIDGCQKSVIV